jgi:hypothetical protein
MRSIRFRVLLGTALTTAVCCGIGARLARADLKEIEKMIQRDGKLSLPSEPDHKPLPKTPQDKDGTTKGPHTAGAAAAVDRTNTPYMRLAKTLFKGKARTVAAINLSTKQKVGSHVTQVGGDGVPAGFGKSFDWDRKDQAIKLVLIVNAGDPLGISLLALRYQLAPRPRMSLMATPPRCGRSLPSNRRPTTPDGGEYRCVSMIELQ